MSKCILPCLFITIILIFILFIQPDNLDNFKISTGNTGGGPHFGGAISSGNYRGGHVGYGSGYYRPWYNYYYDYPYYTFNRECLTPCCDYSNCIAGNGCMWKSIDNKWLYGNSEQCTRYKNCLELSKEKDKCIEFAGIKNI